MPAPFILDPDYRDFVPGQTPLKLTTLYRGGGFDFALVVVFSVSAALLLALCVALMVGMGEVNVVTLMLVVVCVGLGAVLRWGGRETRRYVWARRVYPLLQAHGVVLEGTLTDVQRRVVSTSRLPSQHYIDIAYTFTTPDGRTLSGRQSQQREDLRKVRLPAVGTPVRVLWVEGEGDGAAWVVML